MGQIKLETQNEVFNTVSLTPEEAALFESQWQTLFFPPWNLERQLINQRKNTVLQGVEAAKDALDERAFGGFNAGAGEIGISIIRPGHVGLAFDGTNDNAEADNVWEWKGLATRPSYDTGYNGWIHSPTAATTNFEVHEYEFVIPLYIVEEDAAPKLQCIQMTIGRADILEYDVAPMRIKDGTSNISIIPLPTTFWQPKMEAHIAVQAATNGKLNIRLGGFTVGLGTFLNASVYKGSSNTIITVAKDWT